MVEIMAMKRTDALAEITASQSICDGTFNNTNELSRV